MRTELHTKLKYTQKYALWYSFSKYFAIWPRAISKELKLEVLDNAIASVFENYLKSLEIGMLKFY